LSLTKSFFSSLTAVINTQWHTCTVLAVDIVRFVFKYETNTNLIWYFFCLFFFKKWVSTKCVSVKITKGNVTFASAFQYPLSKDCIQSNSIQTRALLNLNKNNCKIFLRAKQLLVKGLIDKRCHALEAVPERRAIHKLNAIFFPTEN